MANTEAVRDSVDAWTVEALGPLTPDSLPMLDALVVHSGWNQTAQDWGVFASFGSIYAVRDAEGRIVASGAVLPMGKRRSGYLAGLTGRGVAWISMILVAPALRGQGLGRRVFDHCLRHVQDEDRIAMLDATPQGEALYRQFGFEPLWRLTRWRRGASPATQTAPADKPALEALAVMDTDALGFDRTALLGELLGRPDSFCVRSAQGFAVVRSGRVAHHIGPLLATDEESAAALLRRAVACLPGPVLIDVPDDRPLVRRALTEAGFEPQRGFARMSLERSGHRGNQGQTHLIHAIAGPEFA